MRGTREEGRCQGAALYRSVSRVFGCQLTKQALHPRAVLLSATCRATQPVRPRKRGQQPTHSHAPAARSGAPCPRPERRCGPAARPGPAACAIKQRVAGTQQHCRQQPQSACASTPRAVKQGGERGAAAARQLAAPRHTNARADIRRVPRVCVCAPACAPHTPPKPRAPTWKPCAGATAPNSSLLSVRSAGSSSDAVSREDLVASFPGDIARLLTLLLLPCAVPGPAPVSPTAGAEKPSTRSPGLLAGTPCESGGLLARPACEGVLAADVAKGVLRLKLKLACRGPAGASDDSLRCSGTSAAAPLATVDRPLLRPPRGPLAWMGQEPVLAGGLEPSRGLVKDITGASCGVGCGPAHALHDARGGSRAPHHARWRT
jgi:hypothetical protein